MSNYQMMGKNTWKRVYKGKVIYVHFTKDGWTCDYEDYYKAPKIAVSWFYRKVYGNDDNESYLNR